MHDDDRRRRSPSPSGPSKKRARTSPSNSLPSSSRPTTSNGHAYPPGGGVMATPLKPLSLSILGVEPLDEFIIEIADWIYELIRNIPADLEGQVEVEAKLGLLKERTSNARIQYPARVETILATNDHRFESNMTAAQHKQFNTLLNSLEASARGPNHPSTSPLRYQHTYLIDVFYPSEGRDSEKIRVTQDEKTGEVKECLKKIRLGNLDIYSPKRNADWRVSVNLEIPVPKPTNPPSFARRKDRMSYSHEEYVIDLTQVMQNVSTGQPQITHELEVEFAHPSVLLTTAAVRGNPDVPPAERDAFDELIRAFVNNVRILVRNAKAA